MSGPRTSICRNSTLALLPRLPLALTHCQTQMQRLSTAVERGRCASETRTLRDGTREVLQLSSRGHSLQVR